MSKATLLKRKDNAGISDRILGAKNIRRELKANFPNTKFSVKSEIYSGGDSIKVYWTDGPTSETVTAIIEKYQEGTFDGMIDLYSYSGDQFNEDHGGAKYVFGQRDNSVEVEVEQFEKMCDELGLEIDSDVKQSTYGGAWLSIDDSARIFDTWATTYFRQYISKIDFSGNEVTA